MCDLRQSVDVLTLASKLIGTTKSVYFDSGIYKHCEYEYRTSQYGSRNLADDIFSIFASTNEPITLDSVLKLFKTLQKQRDNVLVQRSFRYEGITHNVETNVFKINWGS